MGPTMTRNDIYTTRSSKPASPLQTGADPSKSPPDNVWLMSLRRQRLQNVFTALLGLAIVGLVIVVSFQQARMADDQPVDGARFETSPPMIGAVDVQRSGRPPVDARYAGLLDLLTDHPSQQERVPTGDPWHREWLKRATYHLLQAEQAQRTQDTEASLHHYQAALDIFPQLRGVYPLMAAIHMDAGAYQQAAAAFEQAREQEPLSPASANNLGVIYLRIGNLEKAEKEFRAAIEAQTDYPQAQFNMALVYAEQNRPAEALRAFEIYAGLEPRHLQPMISLASLLADGQHWEQAAYLLTRADRVMPATPELLFQLAKAHTQAGQHREAMAALTRAVDQVDPRHALAWMSRRVFDPLRGESAFEDLIVQLSETP